MKLLLDPKESRSLPLWMVFPLIFLAVFLSHVALLRLPYYWDEAGYYIPAAYDFFRSGTLIPYSTLTNAHPPLPSVYLAFWWKLSGFTPAVTRIAVCFMASLGLAAVWQLANKLQPRVSVAAWTTFLTGLYPIWFAQSTLAHADIFAAAATLWALVFVLPNENHKPWLAALLFSLSVLAKETAIVTPALLATFEAVLLLKARGKNLALRLSNICWYMAPVLPLLCWYAYHHMKTGFTFGNPEFLRYNATSTLSAVRVLAAFGHRLLHLTGHMNMFVPVICAAAALLLEPIKNNSEKTAIRGIPLARIFWLLLGNAAAFAVLGGALLTRYLLPMYPLVLLLCASTLCSRVRLWQGLTALSALAFLAGLFFNPPYRFAPEDNLTYSYVIRMQQQAAHLIETRFYHDPVLTAWPVSDELTKPELGYVKKPLQTVNIDNFSAPEIEKAQKQLDKFSSAVVFSTKYDPPHLPLSLGAKSESLDEKYFGLHHDLLPDQAAKALHGEVFWRTERAGQWAAIIQFPRMQLAYLERP